MEKPFGEYQQKPTIIQTKARLKVINEDPIEIQTTPVTVTHQLKNTDTDIQDIIQ